MSKLFSWPLGGSLSKVSNFLEKLKFKLSKSSSKETSSFKNEKIQEKQVEPEKVTTTTPPKLPEFSKAKKYKTSSPAKKLLTLVPKISPKQSRILDIAAEVQEKSAKEAGSLLFMSKPFVQTTLPHRNPGKVEAWSRQNGRVTLLIRPGIVKNPNTGHFESLGVPFGVIPRLLLIWISSEVMKSDKRILELGETLSDFMRDLGLDPRHAGKGGGITRLKEQLLRLFRCTISFDEIIKDRNQTTNNWLDMQVVYRGSMSWIDDERYSFQSLKEDLKEINQRSWVELSEPFFNMVKQSCVPLDNRIIREIKQSPLALDLYAWMIHRTYKVGSDNLYKQKPSFISWQQLHDQFGTNYKNIKDFTKELKPILKKVQALSLNLHLEEASGGLKIGARDGRIRLVP